MGKAGAVLRWIAAGVMGVQLGLAADAAGPGPSLPPLEAFGALPKTSPPQLAPDGQHFAVIQALQGRPVAIIYSTFAKPGAKPAIVRGDAAIVEEVRWASNDRLIVITKQPKRQELDFGSETLTWRRAFAVDVDGSNLVALMKNRSARNYNTDSSTVINVGLDDPDHIFMTMYQNNELEVFKVDIHTGNAELFERGVAGNYDQPSTFQWLMDGHGHVVARIDATAKPLVDHVMVRSNEQWKEIGQFDATADNGAGLMGLQENEQSLLFLRQNEQRFGGIVQTDLAGAKAKPLFFVDGHDVDGVLINKWTGHIIGASFVDDRRQYRYFDPSLQALQNGIEQAFPGLSVHIVSMDLARHFMIIEVNGPRQPPTYYLLDRTTHLTQMLSESYPGLHEADLSEMKPYPYTARDGVPIHSYLTLPAGKTATNLPVVIFPHGGPDARDALRFDWLVQFLASRGYAVLQPNFRGSSGYGHKFTELGLAEWGRGVQNDVTDGVKKLIADGIADPKRVCIFGASFGGYVAMAGATLTPELYACSASWAGVSDLEQALHVTYREGGENSSLVSFWLSRIGKADDRADRARLQAGSPDRLAERVKAPMLLMHAALDTTVSVEQSQLMRDALKLAHKKVTYIELADDDHYMSVGSTRIAVLKALEQFLKENIGN